MHHVITNHERHHQLHRDTAAEHAGTHDAGIIAIHGVAGETLLRRDTAFYPRHVKFMCSDPLVALVLRRENAISAWRQLIGSTSESTSLRGLYATDGTRNSVHGSDSPAAATREVAYIFDEVAPLSQSTFALIKPDGMSHRDAILERLAQEGFDLTRIQHIDRLATEQARLFFTNKHMWQHQSPPVEKEKSAAGAATTAAADGSSRPSPDE